MIDTESLSCQELVELVTDYLEGALDDRDVRAFEGHLAGCDGVHRVRRAAANDDQARRDTHAG